MSEQRRIIQPRPELAVIGTNLDRLSEADISAIAVGGAEVGVNLETGDLEPILAVYGVIASLGMTNAEITRESSFSECTVKKRLTELGDKTKIRGRAGWARYFFETGVYANTHVEPAVSPIRNTLHRSALENISYGKTNEQTGRTIYRTEETVKFYVREMGRISGWQGQVRQVLAAFAAGEFGYYPPKDSE